MGGLGIDSAKADFAGVAVVAGKQARRSRLETQSRSVSLSGMGIYGDVAPTRITSRYQAPVTSRERGKA